MISSSGKRWAENVDHVWEMRSAHIVVGKPEGKSHMVDPSVDGRIILKWI
jgi:hypothetical protein